MKQLTIDSNQILRFIQSKKRMLLLAAGAICLLLSFLPRSTEKTASSLTADSYVSEMEERLTAVVNEMLSCDSARVMITLESSVQTVYADAVKSNTDTTENVEADDSTKTQKKGSEEKEYILVKDKEGNEQALVVAQMMPQIRGVVVVCPGGGQTDVCERVQSAVVTALNISAKKVCVVSSN